MFLSNLMKVWMTFERFLTVLATFDPFCAIFDPIGGSISPFWDQNRNKMGSFWGDFGPFLGRSRVILGSLRDHFGIVWASFWGRFGVVLTSF